MFKKIPSLSLKATDKRTLNNIVTVSIADTRRYRNETNMSYTKDQLLSRLQELEVVFSRYDHPAVLTVEAQAKYVGNEKGALSKNLFLKDKKSRYYIVSALASTKVDLKVLSQRLGLGKGGVRMAPEESLGEILQVPLGCVTPFALVNESARSVSLILDKGFKDQECCFFHPLSNDTSISVNSHDLDKFLVSVQIIPAYVDLEANPFVGKDQPPDLAALVPSDVILVPENTAKTVPSQAPENIITTVDKKSAPVSAKPAKPSKDKLKKEATDACSPCDFFNQEKFVEDILDKTSALIISEINEKTIKQDDQQLGTFVASSIKKQLTSDLIDLARYIKNAAYTEGLQAGTQLRGYRCP